MMSNNNVIDKVIMILGDSGVGKTSIISSFLDFENRAENNRITSVREKEKTICVDYFKLEKRIDDKQYRLNIWDVSGNEMEDKVLPRYLYKNVDLYVLVFSLENIHSLNNLKHWVKLTENKNLILVKNKSDLKRISDDTIRKFRDEVLKNEVFFEKEFHTNYRDYNSLKRLFNYFYEKFSGKSLTLDNEESSENKKCYSFCNLWKCCC